MPYARCSKCKVNDTGAKTTNLKKKTQSSQQTFPTGFFLQSPNFSLLGKQEP